MTVAVRALPPVLSNLRVSKAFIWLFQSNTAPVQLNTIKLVRQPTELYETENSQCVPGRDEITEKECDLQLLEHLFTDLIENELRLD